MQKVYVRCPVCGENGMPKELDQEAVDDPTPGCADGYITCGNLCCASNGGSNYSALERKITEAKALLS